MKNPQSSNPRRQSEGSICLCQVKFYVADSVEGKSTHIGSLLKFSQNDHYWVVWIFLYLRVFVP